MSYARVRYREIFGGDEKKSTVAYKAILATKRSFTIIERGKDHLTFMM